MRSSTGNRGVVVLCIAMVVMLLCEESQVCLFSPLLLLYAVIGSLALHIIRASSIAINQGRNVYLELVQQAKMLNLAVFPCPRDAIRISSVYKLNCNYNVGHKHELEL